MPFALSDSFDLEAFEAEEGEDGRLMATVTILRAGKSKNNRNYRESAVREAATNSSFHGVRMFVNHDKDRPPVKRSLTEMVSAIESTSYDETKKAMVGKVEFFDKGFYDYARRAYRYMGDSINALVQGTRTRTPGGVVEEDIHRIVQPRSVDWVIYPAAGGEIVAFEDESGEEDQMDWTTVTLEDIKQNAPALIEQIKAEVKTEDTTPLDDKKIDEKIAEIVKARMEAYDQERQETIRKQEAAKKQVLEHLAKAGLPDRTRTRIAASFEGVEEFEQEKLDKVITEAKEELAAAGAGPHITGQGPSSGSGEPAGKNFSVKESVESFFKAPAKKEGDKK